LENGSVKLISHRAPRCTFSAQGQKHSNCVPKALGDGDAERDGDDEGDSDPAKSEASD
jgi:hypothetical protein